MTFDDRSLAGDAAGAADRLDHLWDEVTGRASARPGAFSRPVSVSVDPTDPDAVAIHRLHLLASDAMPTLRDDARGRIWRAAVRDAGIPTKEDHPMSAMPLPVGAPPAPAVSPPVPPRQRRLAPARLSPGHSPAPRRAVRPQDGAAWWPRLQFAAVLLLLGGLLASILAPYREESPGIFGGPDDTVTPVASATLPVATPAYDLYTPVEVALPATSTDHVVARDRIGIVPGDSLDLAADVVTVVAPVEGQIAVTTSDTGAVTTLGAGESVVVPMGGGSVEADSGAATVVVTRLAAGDAGLPAWPATVSVTPVAGYSTGAFAGQPSAWMVYATREIGTYYGNVVTQEIDISDAFFPFIGPGIEAFVTADRGAIQLRSPGGQARVILAGTTMPAAGQAEPLLSAGDSAVIADAAVSQFRASTDAGATMSALIIAPAGATGPGGQARPAMGSTPVTDATGTPGADVDQGQSVEVAIALPERVTVASGEIERVRVEPGAEWVVPGSDSSGVVMVSGRATVRVGDSPLYGEADPLAYPGTVMAEPGMTFMALGAEPVVLIRAALHVGPERVADPGQPGVTIEALGAPVQVFNVGNASGVTLTLHAGTADVTAQYPYRLPRGARWPAPAGSIIPLGSGLSVSSSGSQMQVLPLGGPANIATVGPGESISTIGTGGFTVSAETPTPFVSLTATGTYEGLTSRVELAEDPVLFDGNVTVPNPDLLAMIAQLQMAPGSSYRYRTSDNPGGTLVIVATAGDAAVRVGDAEPVAVGGTAGPVATVTATADVEIIPGQAGATLYVAEIGSPFPLNGTGGYEGSGDVGVSFAGSLSNGYHAATTILSGETARVTVGVESIGTEPATYDAGDGGLILLPMDGQLTVTRVAGVPTLSSLLLATGPPVDPTPDPGPLPIVPGDAVQAGPGVAVALAADEDPVRVLTFRIAPPGDQGGVPGDAEATPVTLGPALAPAGFTSGEALIEVPASDDGHRVTIDRARIPGGEALDLPAGSTYALQAVTGSAMVEMDGEVVDLAGSSVTFVGTGGARVLAGADGVSVTVLTIAPRSDDPFTLVPSGGISLVPILTWTTDELAGVDQVRLGFGRGAVPDEAGALPLTGGRAAGSIVILASEVGATRLMAPDASIQDIGQGPYPNEPAADVVLQPGANALLDDPTVTTFQRLEPGNGAVFTLVTIDLTEASPVTPEATPAA